MPFLLDINNATVCRGHRNVLSDVTLQIPADCHTAILGPNGSGKSTLLKLLTRELFPIAHLDTHVRVLGRERWDVWALRKQLGIVSHDLQVGYLGFATGMQVALSGFEASISTWDHQQYSDEQRGRAWDVLQFLGIHELADRRFDCMSTGEQRRCVLARALVNDPHTLVLDEPTSGLDINACFQYLDVLRRLINEGKSVIVVTHHIHEIPPEVDSFIFMKNGSVISQGSREQLFTSRKLSQLFETNVRLVEESGAFFVLPDNHTN